MVANQKGCAVHSKCFAAGETPNLLFLIYYFLFVYISIPHSPALHHTIHLIFGAKIGDNLAFRQLHFARTARIIEA